MKELLELFFEFFKVGLFTFGGGYAMISQIRETAVEKKKWLTDEELLKIITVSESTPGPIAINMATYIGYRKKGLGGSAFATLGVVLPSFVIIYIISFIADIFKDNVYVGYAFTGIKAAVAFLILKTGISMFLKMPKKLLPTVIFCAVFSLALLFELTAVAFSSVFYIIIGGVIGIFNYAVFFGTKEETK